MNKLKALCRRHKEFLLYIFFGGFTTIVSLGSFILFHRMLHIHELISNVLSWILAVGVAYITNRFWVFHSKSKGTDFWMEVFAFYGGRLATLGMEEGLLLVFATCLAFDGTAVKLVAQVLVSIGNFVISKFLIFRRKG